MNLKTKIKIGRLDRPVTISRLAVVYDALNQPTKTYADDSGIVWAQMTNKTGKEPNKGEKEVSIRNTFFIVRYTANTASITEKDLVKYNSKAYEIIASYEEENARNRYMILATSLIQ